MEIRSKRKNKMTNSIKITVLTENDGVWKGRVSNPVLYYVYTNGFKQTMKNTH